MKLDLILRNRSLASATLLVLGLLPAAESQALWVDPARCQADSLDVGAPVEGRNGWLKRCNPAAYDVVFSEGEFTFNKVKYARQLYVTYGVPNAAGGYDFPGNWIAPTNANGDCSVPAGYRIIGVCTSGCYAPDQKLEFENGLLEIKSAMEAKTPNVVTLRSDSTREKPATQSSPIRNFLTDVKDAQQELLEFRTASGGSIVVTMNHPLLDGEGRMREASSLQVGESLVKADGQLDPIVSITGKSYFGKVYNLAVDSSDDLENIVVAQGFLNGSLHYQDGAGVQKLNQVIFRSFVIPAELVK